MSDDQSINLFKAGRRAGLRDYVPVAALLTANIISLVGSTFTLLAIPWYVLVTTGSPAKTGVAATVGTIGYVLSGVLGGAAVDRVGFKRTSLLSDAASGLSVALIPLLADTIGPAFWQLLLLVFLASFFGVPGSAGRESLLPNLAGRAKIPLERANSLYHAAPRLSQLVGPPLAGVLIALLGTRNVLWLDAASFAASVAIIGIAIPRFHAGRESRPPPRLMVRRYLGDVADGLRLLRRDALLLAMTLNNTAGNFIGAALSGVILPVYAREIYGSAVDLGLLFSAYGGGALLGLLLYGAIGHRFPRRATYTVSWILDGILLWALVVELGLPVVLAVLLLWGIVGSPNLPLTFTVAQERVPEEQRGRFFGTRAALANAASPFGILLAGYLIEGAGLRASLVVAAALSLLVSLNAVVNPAFRHLRSASSTTGTVDTLGGDA